MKFREGKELVSGHPANEWQGDNSKLQLSYPKNSSFNDSAALLPRNPKVIHSFS